MTRNFAITGVGGYVAPRHLRAIRDTGNRLLAAVDPKDSVGLLDQYSLDVRFFTEVERFDRFLEKARRSGESSRVHWLSVCSPNYLHDAHCRMGLRVGADVICEKPLVINPWNLDALQQLESETSCRIYTVLQLRTHPALIALRERIEAERGTVHDVELTYITSRGRWYDVSWKGQLEKSGGIPTNIGIHFFDLLIWLFGSVSDHRVHLSEARRMGGFIELERARVRWFLSVETSDLEAVRQLGLDRARAPEAPKSTFRKITVDGDEVEFSEGFDDLHTRVYAETLAGRGYGIEETRPSVDLVYALRRSSITGAGLSPAHPLLTSIRGEGR